MSETVEIDREVVEDTIEMLGSVSLTLRGATAYSKAEKVERQREELEEEME